MLRFEHRCEIQAPLGDVAGFHRSASNLRAVTPPWVPMRILEAPDSLEPGTEMAFRLWLGPLPVLWRARLEAIDGAGFADVQIEGPFEAWRHEHRFEAAQSRGGHLSTWIIDRIEARLRRHPFWGVVGLQMWLGMPTLFAYRQWKLRRLLETERS